MVQGHTDSPTRATRVAVKIRLHPDTKERVGYWATKGGISENEFMAAAVEFYIAYQNGDYPLATLEMARLGQLVDQMASLTRNVNNLDHTVSTGMDSLLGLTRGGSYLLDDESGELHEHGGASRPEIGTVGIPGIGAGH